MKTKWDVVTWGVPRRPRWHARQQTDTFSLCTVISYQDSPQVVFQLPVLSFDIFPLALQCNQNDFSKRYISACHLPDISLFSGFLLLWGQNSNLSPSFLVSAQSGSCLPAWPLATSSLTPCAPGTLNRRPQFLQHSVHSLLPLGSLLHHLSLPAIMAT